MTLTVPGITIPVPMLWMPASDPDFKDKSEGGRSGYQPIAIVHHRIVGSLNSADSTFAANDTDPATVGSTSRSVSSTFAIGYDTNGKLEIHQYVDVSDTAYANGDESSSGSWDEWYGDNNMHNERTVSIEHDDQGGSTDATKKGIVREDIIKASIALDRLLLSGDIAMMRAAGIHIRDQATADALKKIVPGPKTLIDHHDIAGTNKPYCWRPWSADKIGFPRTRYITELTTVTTPPPPPPPLATYTQAQLDAAILAATTETKTALATAVQEIATLNNMLTEMATEDQLVAAKLVELATQLTT